MKTYNITNDFIPTLLSLIIKEKSKYIKVSNYDLAFLRTNLRLRSDVSFSLETNKLRVKTGNRIRNPKDFDKFIDTYIESTLILDSRLSPRVVIFDQPYAYSEYVEEGLDRLVEKPLQTQSLEDLTTEGSYDFDILETESLKVFITLTTQDLKVLTLQNSKPLEFPTYDFNFSEILQTQSGQNIELKYYNRNLLSPLLVKGFEKQSYSRVYKLN